MRFNIENDKNYTNIFNMEETPIWFEMMSRTTIAKIGEKLKIQKNLYVINRKIYVLCQENSWADSEIFQYWLEKIFFYNMHINNNLKKTLY